MEVINKDYGNILLRIDGKTSLSNIIKHFEVLKNNIYKYIENAYFKGWIEFSDTPKPYCSSHLVTGDREYFYPIHLAIELTDRCNLRCLHCYRSSTCEGIFIEKDKLFKIVEVLTKKGLRMVELTGGEPTLHPNFIEILSYLLSKLELVAILTNGTTIEEQVYKFLKINSDKLLINVSLDSSTPEFHDKFRGVKGSWEKACKIIAKLSNDGFIVRVAMSIALENMMDVENTLLLAKKLGAVSFAWDLCNSFGRGSNIDWSIVRDEEWMKYEAMSKYILKKYHYMINFLPPSSIRKMSLGEENCGAGWRTFVLGPDGNLRICVNSPITLFKIGNIFEEGAKILKNKILEELSEIPLPRYESCKNCKFYAFCNNCIVKAVITAKNYDKCEWEGKRLIEYSDIIDNNLVCFIKKSIVY